MGIKKETEKSFMATVRAVAKLHGWTGYHTLRSIGSEEGFPDLVFRRGSGYAQRLLVAELKLDGKKPTPAQAAWIETFSYAGVPAYVWRPADWKQIEEILARQEPEAVVVNRKALSLIELAQLVRRTRDAQNRYAREQKPQTFDAARVKKTTVSIAQVRKLERALDEAVSDILDDTPSLFDDLEKEKEGLPD